MNRAERKILTSETTASKPVSKTLHLQLQAKLPGVTTSDPAPNATVPKQRPIRQQPKGMRMRFFPIGVQKPSRAIHPAEEENDEEESADFRVPGAVDDSDVEMADAQPSEKSEKRKHKSDKKEKKRTKGEDVGSIEDEAERKKRKKEKKEKKVKAVGATA